MAPDGLSLGYIFQLLVAVPLHLCSPQHPEEAIPIIQCSTTTTNIKNILTECV